MHIISYLQQPYSNQFLAFAKKNGGYFKLLLCFIFLLLSSLTFSEVKEKQKVLILHSYHQGYEWTDNIHEGIIETLNDYNDNNNIKVFIEYMDIIRNPGEDHISLLENLYNKKYTKRGIDFGAIIVADDPAFDFVLEKRDALFYDAPVVFLGINDFSFEKLEKINGITGVKAVTSMKESIEVALQLIDDLERIAVVSGARFTEKVFFERFKSVSQSYKEKVDFLYFNELEADQLMDKLGNLKENDAVFYLLNLLTPSQQSFTVKENINLIKRATSVPVFSLWSFVIEYGVIGGKVVDEYSYGKTASETAIEILQGADVNEIPIKTSSNKYIFNGRELYEHKISKELLPFNSDIINRMPFHLIEDWDELVKDNLFGYDLFQGHGNIMLLIDPNTGIIIDANRAAFNFYGYPDMIGKSLYDINILSTAEIQEEIEDARRYERNFFRFEHILSDSTIRNVEAYSYPVDINNTEILFSIITDVTERVEYEEAIKKTRRRVLIFAGFGLIFLLASIFILINRNKIIKRQKDKITESEEKYRRIAENVSDVVWMADLNFRITYVSPSVERVFSETPGIHINKSLEEKMPAESIDKVTSVFVEEMEKENDPNCDKNRSRFIEIEHYRADGSKIWVDMNVSFIRDKDGKAIGFQGVTRDINERKKTEAMLRENEERMRAIVENLNEIIYILDENAKIKYISPNVRSIGGYNADEILNRSFIDFVHPNDLDGRIEQFKKNLSGIDEPSEYRFITKTGKSLWVRTNAKPVIKNGKTVGVQGVLTDITKRKLMEQELKETNKNLEEMVYIASHDLQSPLISMEGYSSELLENYRDKLDEEGVYCLIRLYKNAKRMHKLVLSLLDISRLNKANLKLEMFDLGSVFDKIIQDLSLTIENAGARIKVGKLPKINADKQRMENVMRNIIINAINYNGKNIKISFKNNTLSVKDDGIGIPADQLERIFKPGERLKVIEAEGVGMGLTFCKKVVEQHKGKIWAESEGINKGTTIFISIGKMTIREAV